MIEHSRIMSVKCPEAVGGDMKRRLAVHVDKHRLAQTHCHCDGPPARQHELNNCIQMEKQTK